jgi:predicted DsbA family dithiol-disulfide isomerase
LKRLIGEYGPRLNFVFRNLPLTKNHKNALMAAQAAEAARLQGHFMEMHDILYELQDEWKDENDPQPIFLKYAAAAGLDLNRVSRDYDGPEVKQRIESDVRRAESMGIDSTPTILMEGNQLRAEVTNPEGIRKGIELVLARKAAQAR